MAIEHYLATMLVEFGIVFYWIYHMTNCLAAVCRTMPALQRPNTRFSRGLDILSTKGWETRVHSLLFTIGWEIRVHSPFIIIRVHEVSEKEKEQSRCRMLLFHMRWRFNTLQARLGKHVSTYLFRSFQESYPMRSHHKMVGHSSLNSH